MTATMPATPTLEKGPFCQSCGMPLVKPEEFGTDAQGFRVNDYCHYCYASGAFITPNITMDEMLDVCVRALKVQHIMPEAEARALMKDVLPRLKRWAGRTA